MQNWTLFFLLFFAEQICVPKLHKKTLLSFPFLSFICRTCGSSISSSGHIPSCSSPGVSASSSSSSSSSFLILVAPTGRKRERERTTSEVVAGGRVTRRGGGGRVVSASANRTWMQICGNRIPQGRRNKEGKKFFLQMHLGGSRGKLANVGGEKRGVVFQSGGCDNNKKILFCCSSSIFL